MAFDVKRAYSPCPVYSLLFDFFLLWTRERPSPSHQLRETLDQVNVLSDRAVGHSLLVVDL